MDFCIQLSPYLPEKSYGGARLYSDMVELAVLAEQVGFESVSTTEHHLINCLMMPAPLILATKIAAHTQKIKILTSVVVLPLHDMRVFAGEIITADIFCQGRLLLGVGRGAFKYEMERMGIPMDETRERFDESLDVLKTLLNEEEVSWDGKFYKFDALTIMPRPIVPGSPEIMMAVMVPEGIYHCVLRGFHIQTTPLAGNHQLLVNQVEAFNRGKEDLGRTENCPTLSLSRLAHFTMSDKDALSKIDLAYTYYSRFDNVFTGPGIVEHGMIKPLPRNQTREELAESLLICGKQEMIDKLSIYSDLGIDRIILNINFGAEHSEMIENVHRIAEEVMPHFQ